VKARYDVTLSNGVAADQKCVAFYTINTAHILTDRVSTNKYT